MSEFIVSARKYRPLSFATVVGQISITRTLQNAIKNEHLSHAYIFCGPRGVGKTTTARLLAKTINCFHPTDQMEACNECESCVAFNSNRSLNIHELDAASNNSVDDIRNLIDQVRIPPQIGRYSVYIVDEVHMLSNAAFNAFLKTLEEPPKHAIFILATTERHKIPPTVISRCQIFDFSRISIADVVGNLETIAKNEGISYEKDALQVIAEKADGGMRDALSVFDQVVSYSGNKLTYQSIIDILGILDFNYYIKIVDYSLESNYKECLLIFNEILNKGIDGQQFINGLSMHLRNLLVAKDKASMILLDTTDERRKVFEEQSAKVDIDYLLDAIEISNNCEIEYKTAPNKRLLVELALLKLCKIIAKKKAKMNQTK